MTEPPVARVEPTLPWHTKLLRRMNTRMWWATLACGLVVVVLVVLSARTVGRAVAIRFDEGHGIKPGDAVRYRGIDVGMVETVEVAPDQEGVRVTVRMSPSGSDLARAGSRFWIERPRLGLEGISGLETILVGNFIGISPGPAGAEAIDEFEGLADPPVVAERLEGALEVIVESPSRTGLQPGSPVIYRGIQIGKVTSVGLSIDATRVDSRLYIEPGYRNLVRANAVFWGAGGLKAGLTKGVQFDSLTTVLQGGIALAVPDRTGPAVATGHRFRLQEEEPDDWLEWMPHIAIGGDLLPEGLTPPRPLRALKVWSKSTLGLKRQQQRGGWLLPLANGRLLGPADMLEPEPDAVDGRTTLSVAGKTLELAHDALEPLGDLVVMNAPGIPAGFWPGYRMRTVPAPEDAVLIGDTASSWIPLPAEKISEGWRTDPSLPLDSAWHGACVVSRSDAALVGILLVKDGGGRVAPLPQVLAGGN